MKLKIAAIAMMAFSFAMNAQKNFTKNIVVNASSAVELTDETNNSLDVNSSYKIQLVTRGTGTKTGAEYLAWSNNGQWLIRAVNVAGTTSNHPLLVVESNIVKVKTNHPNNYNIRVFVTELETAEDASVSNIFGSSYQWQRNANNLFYNDGNVGIGTDNPEAKLEILGTKGIRLRGSTNVEQYMNIIPLVDVKSLNPGSSSAAAQITNLNLQHLVLDIKANDANDSFAIRTDSNYDGAVDQISMVVKPNGNIGIGVTKPESKLDVNGIITAKNEIRSKSSNPAILLDESDVADKNWHMQVNGGDLKFYEVNDARNSWKQRMVIKPTTGSVGIGTTTTGSHKLAVEGSIGAREIKVQASGWADFVFENNYKLPTLKDVEKHIKEKGHLENIPSAVEVKKDGFFLGEMDAKLLRKIEELTLYTIDQEKKLKTQEVKIEKLEKENSVLKSLLERVSKLEKQVNKQ